MSDLKITGLTKSFDKLEVIPPLDLYVPDGSFTVLVGPSGCGKSTLLRMIAGLEVPSSGRLELSGKDITQAEPADREIAMVFQSYALYPHMSVERNIEFGLKLARVDIEERKRRISEAARMLQLEQLLERKPAALSGGQRQRVAIGRAIVRDPKVFLFDEPLSNLDAALRAKMRVELAELHARLGTTMIYVTHDQTEAMTLADQIVIMNKGKIEQMGSPIEAYDRPATRFVAEFLGAPRMNVSEQEKAKSSGAFALGLRPEDIGIVQNQTQNSWQGRVRLVERLGAETIIYTDTDGFGDLVVRAKSDVQVSPNDVVHILPDLSKAHRFGEDGNRIDP
ncbi:MAG: sn-glycerol-3-phosphate ABC transporter ATP-binding protein UgpC [Henriciella sp.]|nr:sn-glycerol-3-phosphate ABC transporter ATP-binding protein UgpC [Henriciella sp.]